MGLPLLCFSNSLCCGIPISGLTRSQERNSDQNLLLIKLLQSEDTGPGDASALICACTSAVYTAARASFRLRACWSWNTEGMEAILMLERMSHLQHCPKPPLYYEGDIKVLWSEYKCNWKCFPVQHWRRKRPSDFTFFFSETELLHFARVLMSFLANRGLNVSSVDKSAYRSSPLSIFF